MSTKFSFIQLGFFCFLIWAACCYSSADAQTQVSSKKVSRKLHPFSPTPDLSQNSVQHTLESSQSESPVTIHKRSSMEWIRDYLTEYLAERTNMFSDTALSSRSSKDTTEVGRQMPTQSSLGDAIAVAGLALLFINQIAVALNITHLLPLLLIPVILITVIVKLFSKAGSMSQGMMMGSESYPAMDWAQW